MWICIMEIDSFQEATMNELLLIVVLMGFSIAAALVLFLQSFYKSNRDL